MLMPVVNAPFRLYWAYNLSIVNTNLQPPVAADRSFFPNNATYQSVLDRPLASRSRIDERRSHFPLFDWANILVRGSHPGRSACVTIKVELPEGIGSRWLREAV